MRDNSLHIAAYGADPVEREKRLRQLFAMRLKNPTFLAGSVLARDADDKVVGFYGALPLGTCKPSITERISMVLDLIRLGLGNAMRTASWFGAWCKHDFASPQWHFGPFAVDAHLQGQGIGSRMVQHFLTEIDASSGRVYLEADKPENLAFYEKAGFGVIDEITVLGVPNWRMVREPVSPADENGA